MVNLLQTRYHPSRATNRKEAGIFNDYQFKDGTTLRVRRMFEKKLFYPKWWRVKRLRGKPLWQPEGKLEPRNKDFDITVHSAGKLKIVARGIPTSFKRSLVRTTSALSAFLEKRIRIESPLFELHTPKEGSLIGTQFVEGEKLANFLNRTPIETADQFLGEVAKIMAYQHAQGLSHGHMHPDNVIIRNGKIVLVDPKYLIPLREVPLPSGLKARTERAIGLNEASKSPFGFMAIWANPPDHIETDLWTATKDLSKRRQELFMEKYSEAYRTEFEKMKQREAQRKKG